MPLAYQARAVREKRPSGSSVRSASRSAAGDRPLRCPGPALLPLGGRVNLPHRGPEQVQHRHAAVRDVPRARGNRAARTCDPNHLADTLVGVLHEGQHERGERGVELPVGPRQRLCSPLPNVGTGAPIAASGHELGGGIDRGDVRGAEPGGKLNREAARPAPDVDDPHPGGQADRLSECGCERRQVAPHEAVVVLCGGRELHRLSQAASGAGVKARPWRTTTAS